MSASEAIRVISGRPTGSATTQASVLVGLDAHPVSVEVCSTRGPGGFQMVGLAEATVRESRVRIEGALASLGVLLNQYAVTVNLAPADLRKSGAALDVAIALGVLIFIEQAMPGDLLDKTFGSHTADRIGAYGTTFWMFLGLWVLCLLHSLKLKHREPAYADPEPAVTSSSA